jgi:hypothetical protein
VKAVITGQSNSEMVPALTEPTCAVDNCLNTIGCIAEIVAACIVVKADAGIGSNCAYDIDAAAEIGK